MKLNKASSNGESNMQQPMGDASLSPEQNMEMNQNTSGMDMNMADDNNMNAIDPNMNLDNANNMGMESDMNANTESDEAMSIINQLSDKDKEAVKKYAESMLNRDEAQGNNEEQQTENNPMMEQVVFTKKQLNKIQENFGPSQDELLNKKDRKKLPKKNSNINDSPFNPPSFS